MPRQMGRLMRRRFQVSHQIPRIYELIVFTTLTWYVGSLPVLSNADHLAELET